MKLRKQFWLLEPLEEKYQLVYQNNKWVSKKLRDRDLNHQSEIPCRSLKVAKRHLRKHNEIPIGTKFMLVSSFVNADVILTKRKIRGK